MLEPAHAYGPPLIGALLRMPTDVIRRAIVEGLHAHGYTDLTPAHFPVLRYPGPQGQRPVDLAAQVGMTKQAMNYLLGQLETLGYLERRVDQNDVRSRRVYLTARGEAIVKVIRDAVRDVEARWAAELGEADMQQLRELLIRLNTIALNGESRR
jgi:DNA-binding MarR family transcriptional regulator